MDLGRLLKVILVIIIVPAVVLFFYYLFTPSAAADSDTNRPDYLVTLLSWLPMLLVIAIWIFFMWHMRLGRSETMQHLERYKQHMEMVENKLDRIVDLLEKRGRE